MKRCGHLAEVFRQIYVLELPPDVCRQRPNRGQVNLTFLGGVPRFDGRLLTLGDGSTRLARSASDQQRPHFIDFGVEISIRHYSDSREELP